ncbi:MAG: hypothetical protein OXI94_10635 [Gemmatimonadota bacterium]|nr:hypothetical protein [Gemmatimonadota bacterium]
MLGTNPIDEDGGSTTVTATLSGESSEAVTLTVVAAAGADTVDGDFTLSGTTLTIAAGATASTGTVTITAVNNNVDAPDKTVIVSATASGGGVANPASKTLTIEDDDSTPPTALTITVDTDSNKGENQNSVDEGAGATTVTVTATLDGTNRFGVNKTVTVKVGKDSDTAVEGTDYETVDDLTFTINAGQASGSKTFTLTPDDDAIDEEDETISVEGTLAGLTVTNDSITITDDDEAPTGLTISVNTDISARNPNASTDESLVDEDAGTTPVTVTATLDGTSRYADAKTVTVTVGASSDTATEGTDYETVDDLIFTINAGEASASKEFTLTPINDDLAEGGERISLGGTLEELKVTGSTITITDDDTAPTGITLTVSPDSVGEEDGKTKIMVTAAVNGTTRYVDAKTVKVSVGGGTATSGTDYTAVGSFDITIDAGAPSETGTFDLTPTDDSIHEGDETISVTGSISDSITVTAATITIEDDEDVPVISINSPSVKESGKSGVATAMTFTVAIFPASTRPVSVFFADTGTGTATPGKDYVSPGSGILTFAPETTRRTVEVTVNGDDIDEYDETIVVRLSNPTNATLPGNAATLESTGTIIDNNEPPTVFIMDANPVEEGYAAVFSVLLSGESGKIITVRWKTSSGTALEDIDYHGGSEQITIRPGTIEETIEIATIDDREIEDWTETFSIALSDLVDVTPDRVEATGTIKDDDRPAAIERLERVNRTILPYVGSAMMRSRIDHVTGCIRHAASGVTYGDLSSLEGQLRNNADILDQHQMERISLLDVFNDARFATEFKSYEEKHNPGDVTFCAGGDWNELSGGDDDPVTWDGHLAGTHLGGNVRLTEWILTGLDLFFYTGSFDWKDNGGKDEFAGIEGEWNLNMRGVNPYVALLSEDGETRFWTMAGYGFGRVNIVEEILDQSADITMKSLALGGVMPLRRISNVSLDLRGDFWLAEFEIADNGDLIESVSVQTRGVRALLESTWLGASFTPSLRVGVKHDNSSADSTGMEIGSGIEWRARPEGLKMFFRSRALIVPGRVQEWGVGADVLLAPSDGLGPSLRATTSRGNSQENAAALLENSSQTEFSESGTREISVEAEAGWGIRALSGRGVMTPFAGISLLGRDENVLRLGGRVNSGKAFGLELEGRRENGNTDGQVYELFLQLRFSFQGKKSFSDNLELSGLDSRQIHMPANYGRIPEQRFMSDGLER